MSLINRKLTEASARHIEVVGTLGERHLQVIRERLDWNRNCCIPNCKFPNSHSVLFSPSVKILKHVRNRYYDITVTVSCKAHAQRPRAVLYKVK